MKSHRLVLAATVVLTSGCIDGTAPDEVGRAAAALTPVTWTDTVRVSAVGNDLTKTAPETTWNAGAVSVESLAGDGFVEFTTREATTDKAAGLSNGNATTKLGDIDFAIRLSATGLASVWEGATLRFKMGRYIAGDVFRVQVMGGVVTYHRNGVLKYTSAVAPSSPLLVDTALHTPGATLEDVVLESLDFWTAAVGVAVVGDRITKTAPEDTFNAGAVSIATIPAGDGYVEFRAADVSTIKAAGLSNGDGDQRLGDIDFAIYLGAAGGLSIWEAGTKIGSFGKYTSADTFQVGVSDGVVTYYKNWAPLYTSLATATYPLFLDTALRSPGAQILGARLVADPAVDCSPLAQDLSAWGYFTDIKAAGDLLLTTWIQYGYVRIYRRSASSWQEEQLLSVQGSYHFSRTVATDGQTIAVSDGRDPLGGYEGSVYLYRHDGSQWVVDERLSGCTGGDAGNLGLDSTAVQGDLLAFAATSTVCCEANRVYVYRRGADGWGMDAVLTPPDWVGGDGFGSPLAFGGDRLFIGARGKDTAASEAGAIYIYRYNPASPATPPASTCSAPAPGKWELEATVYASNAYPNDRFPNLAIDTSEDGTRLIAGSQRRGTAHFFSSAGGWSEKAILRSDPYRSLFGRDVAFGGPNLGSSSVAIVSANEESAFVFAEVGGEWTPIDFIRSPNTEPARYADHVEAIADTLFISDSLQNSLSGVYIHDIEPICLVE